MRPDSVQSKTRRFDSLQQEAYLSLWRTYDRLRAFEDALFQQFDITAQQYNLLRLLAAAHPKPLPTLDLASRLISRAPDITRMLDKLETLGLIARTRHDADRRTVLVSIARKGQSLLDEIEQPLHECHQQQLGHLSKIQLRSLIDLLKETRRPHETEISPWR